MTTEIIPPEQTTTFDTVEPRDVPVAVAETLIWKSCLYVAQGPLGIDQFDELFMLNNGNGVSSYVASQEKTYSSNGETERIFHIVDADIDYDIIGYSELRHSLTDSNPYFKNKPFIGSIDTTEQYRRTCKGALSLIGRLSLLLTISQEKLGLPLYSDTLMSDDVIRFIKRLERAGLVEEVDDDTHKRYRST